MAAIVACVTFRENYGAASIKKLWKNPWDDKTNMKRTSKKKMTSKKRRPKKWRRPQKWSSITGTWSVEIVYEKTKHKVFFLLILEPIITQINALFLMKCISYHVWHSVLCWPKLFCKYLDIHLSFLWLEYDFELHSRTED